MDDLACPVYFRNALSPRNGRFSMSSLFVELRFVPENGRFSLSSLFVEMRLRLVPEMDDLACPVYL